jgi:hypothetical protein
MECEIFGLSIHFLIKTSMNHISSPSNNYSSLSGYKALMNSAQKRQLPETTGVLVTIDAAGLPQEYRLVTEAETPPDSISIKSTKRHFLSSILETPGTLRGKPEELSSIVLPNDDQTPLTIGQIREVLKQKVSLKAWSQSKIQEIKSGQTISDPRLVTDDQTSVPAEVVEFDHESDDEEAVEFDHESDDEEAEPTPTLLRALYGVGEETTEGLSKAAGIDKSDAGFIVGSTVPTATLTAGTFSSLVSIKLLTGSAVVTKVALAASLAGGGLVALAGLPIAAGALMIGLGARKAGVNLKDYIASFSSSKGEPINPQVQEMLVTCARIPEVNRHIGIEEKRVNHVLDAYFQESKSPIAKNFETIESLNFLDPKDRQRFEQTKKEILGQVEELKKREAHDATISQSQISSDEIMPDPAEDFFKERIPVNDLEESMKKLFGHYDSLKQFIEQVEEHTLPHAASTSLPIGERIEEDHGFRVTSHEDRGVRQQKSPRGTIQAENVSAL